MSRRNVAVHLQDGTFSGYIPKSQAIAEVRAERADWEDVLEQRRIYRRDQRVMPQGKLDIWLPKMSGKNGPLVLQLV